MSEVNNPALQAMLDQYEKNTAKTTTKTTTDFNLENYFSTFLPKDKETGQKVVRILPQLDGSTPFTEIHGHSIKINGEYKTFVCLKHMEGKPCPFCEANEALRATGTEADKELAKNYSSRKMYVLKVIDRDNEAFGPKFWRFKHDYRNSGTMDKIMAIVRAMQINIADIQNGIDLTIMLAKDQNKKTVIQSIVPGLPKPLHTDQSIIDKWVNDPRTWRDVYAIKSYDYLEIIVTGGEPVWDKVQNKFVAKASQEATLSEEAKLSSELTAGLETHKLSMSNSLPTTSNAVTESENDLPF